MDENCDDETEGEKGGLAKLSRWILELGVDDAVSSGAEETF